VTGHLASIVKVHDAQAEVLNMLGVDGDLRDQIARKLTVTDFDPVAFKSDLESSVALSRGAFKGAYAVQLNELSGLARTEIDAISPGISDLQTYDELIAIVKVASSHNLAQAELKNRIVALGDLALKIAKQVPSLAGVLV
jgi:hypothetical protein